MRLNPEESCRPISATYGGSSLATERDSGLKNKTKRKTKEKSPKPQISPLMQDGIEEDAGGVGF